MAGVAVGGDAGDRGGDRHRRAAPQAGGRRPALADRRARFRYVVALDTSRVEHDIGPTFTVWYRTDHDGPRFYQEKAFDREVVEALVDCRSYRYRIESTEMSMRGGRTVAYQVSRGKDLARQEWRTVEPGSIDADVEKAACDVARRAVAMKRR